MNNERFKIFKGRFVSVITKSIRGSQLIDDSLVAEGNVVIEGFLLHEDDVCYYFGKEEDRIDDSIDKDDVVRMYESNSNVDNVFEMIDTAEGEH